MRYATIAACLLGAFLGVSPAIAHVAPSFDTNNRYLKLTPFGDRVRLVYTVYMGERPGAAVRRRMDRNKDGILVDAETTDFQSEIATGARLGLAITLGDGGSSDNGGDSPYELTWSETHVGLGTPTASAGAFSIDLIAWLCLPKDRTQHRLHLADGYNVPEPGELELRVEASPGVTITRSSIGNASAEPKLHFTWNGHPETLAKPGYFLSFTVNPELASRGPAGVCDPADPNRLRTRLATPVAALALLAVFVVFVVFALAAGTFWLRRRAQKSRASA